MKKLIVLLLLIAAVIYIASQTYLTQFNKKQLAQVVGSSSITAGTLQTTTVYAGQRVTFTLTTTPALSDVSIQNLRLELPSAGVSAQPTKLSVSGEATTFNALIPASTQAGEYKVRVNSSPGWEFEQTLIVKAPIESTYEAPVYATDVENEADTVGFNIAVTTPNAKIPTSYRVTWSGGGLGIMVKKVEGNTSGAIKQLTYTQAFPLEDAGYKAFSPFFTLAADGIGLTGISDALLINTSNKEQSVKVTFAPKGKNGMYVFKYEKTLEIKVPPTPLKIAILEKKLLRAGDETRLEAQGLVPLSHLHADMRKAPNLELRLQKANTPGTYVIVPDVKLLSENSLVFTIPTELGVYTTKAGKTTKTGVVPVKAGKYQLVLKSVFGESKFDVSLY